MLKETRAMKDEVGSAKGASGTWSDRLPMDLVGQLIHAWCSSVSTVSVT